MNKIFAWTLWIGVTLAFFCISYYAPNLLSDQGNKFLANFVNENLLSFLGVIVTITLGSAANLHLELNKLQNITDSDFPDARNAIKLSAYWLIFILAISSALVIVKPMLGDDPKLTAICNSLAISFVLFSILVLIDLTSAIFGVPASGTLKKKRTTNSEK